MSNKKGLWSNTTQRNFKNKLNLFNAAPPAKYSHKENGKCNLIIFNYSKEMVNLEVMKKWQIKKKLLRNEFINECKYVKRAQVKKILN